MRGDARAIFPAKTGVGGRIATTAGTLYIVGAFNRSCASTNTIFAQSLPYLARIGIITQCAIIKIRRSAGAKALRAKSNTTTRVIAATGARRAVQGTCAGARNSNTIIVINARLTFIYAAGTFQRGRIFANPAWTIFVIEATAY